jgi:Methyltransferase domain
MTRGKWLLQAAAGMALAVALVVPLTVLSAEDKERGVGDVVYVPTPQVVVDEMLRMAKIGPKDFIIDLGSGDGRMVITAAKKFGAQGFGVDLSDDLLREARANAKIEGVADRAEFRKQNLFETELKQATVLSTYLLPEMNEKLRPKILALPPGPSRCRRKSSAPPVSAMPICGSCRRRWPGAGSRKSTTVANRYSMNSI